MAIERNIFNPDQQSILPNAEILGGINGTAEGLGLPEAIQETAAEVVEGAELVVQDIRDTIDRIYESVAVEADTLGLGAVIDKTPRVFERTAKAETVKSPTFAIRSATPEDLDAIVDVDMKSFREVYDNYDIEEAQHRSELREKFAHRLELVGGEWMPVLEADGKIVAFMTCCPTSKKPEDFESWEKTTDNGTLETTYDPNGENVYVVTLSYLQEARAAKEMLLTNQIGKMLKDGYKLGFFESRLPGLRKWVIRTKLDGQRDADVSSLDPELKNAYAQEYFDEPIKIGGKEVRRDPLVRLYERVGCRTERVVPNAYSDKESMDFGVMCIYDGSSLFDGSDLPIRIPNNRFTRRLFGMAMTRVSKSQKLTQKVMG